MCSGAWNTETLMRSTCRIAHPLTRIRHTAWILGASAPTWSESFNGFKWTFCVSFLLGGRSPIISWPVSPSSSISMWLATWILRAGIPIHSAFWRPFLFFLKRTASISCVPATRTMSPSIMTSIARAAEAAGGSWNSNRVLSTGLHTIQLLFPEWRVSGRWRPSLMAPKSSAFFAGGKHPSGRNSITPGLTSLPANRISLAPRSPN